MYKAEASVGVWRNDREAWMGYKKVLFFAAAHQSVFPRSMTSSVEKGSVETWGLCTWLALSAARPLQTLSPSPEPTDLDLSKHAKPGFSNSPRNSDMRKPSLVP